MHGARLSTAVAVGILLLAGGAWAQAASGPLAEGTPENPLIPADQAHDFSSDIGDFRIMMPSGCAKVKTRTREDDSASGEYIEETVVVYCDRFGKEGDGCSVTAIFNVEGPEGGMPEAPQVTERLENILKTYGAHVTDQRYLEKEFGDGLKAEGIDLLAARTGGSGQMWLRGMLINGDIYIIAAWNESGGVASNPEYVTFFNSFQPGAD
jgi:hypothetical protein|nr:hypothetical protein [Candidatus Krumholzibacteria bacterium]